MEILPEKVVKGQTLAVDNISGATATTTAFLTAVKDALGQAGLKESDLTPVEGGKSGEDVKEYDVDVAVIGAGGASVKRIHRPLDESGKTTAVGNFLVPRLTKLAEDKGVKILYSTPATELMVDENNAVVGVKAGDVTVKAKSVVIATGGFGADLERVASYRPELKGFVTTNAPGIKGDGIDMATKIGAATVDMDQIQIHPTVEQKTSSLIT